VRGRRALFIVSYLAFCAFWFWTQSRYPAINLKAAMGDRTKISAISFDVVWEAGDEDSFPLQIAKSTVNWYYTNWKGMTFGLLFAAGLLALLSVYRFRRFKSRYANALFGTLFGAPLGVCANCATPISTSLYRGGMGFESSVATLFSSPTLNVVALTMVFSMFPVQLAAVKVGLVLFLVLVVVPLIGLALGMDKNEPAMLPAAAKTEVVEPWFSALKGAALELGRSLWSVVRFTVPLMLLAGLLGTVLVESFPDSALSGVQVTAWGLVLASLMGTWLPVPMTFDIIMSSILLKAGLPVPYAMILLFTLGVFSIYPFLMYWRMASRKVAITLFLAVAALGVAGGLLADHLIQREISLASERTKTLSLDSKNRTAAALSNTCGTLPGPRREECKLKVALKTRIGELCQHITGEHELNKCQAAFYGINNGLNPNACLQLKDDEAVKSCVNALFEEAQSHRVDRKHLYRFYSFCARFSEEFPECALFENEKSDVKRRSVLGNCAKFEGKDKEICTDRFKLTVAPRLLDWKLCLDIVDPRKRDQCVLQVVTKMAHGHRAIKICKKMSGETKARCYQLASMKKSVKAGDPSSCLRYLDPMVHSECVTLIAIGAVQTAYFSYLEDSRDLAPSEVLEEDQEGAPRKAARLKFGTVTQVGSVKVSSVVLNKGENKSRFSALDSREQGLRLPPPSVQEFTQEGVITGRGVAAGDYDKDGWDDVVFATPEGPLLFRNLGGLKFAQAPVSMEGVESNLAKESWFTALVDLNDDGWLDLYISSLRGQNFYLVNQQGSFEGSPLVLIPDSTDSLTAAAGFFDVNGDGWLDVLLGNWGANGARAMARTAENRLFTNNQGQFELSEWYTDKVRGQTLSVLFSDINHDRAVDLFIANDFAAPDEIFFGGANKRLRRITTKENIIPAVPYANMSYESGDVNNDGLLDLLAVEIDYSYAKNQTRPYCGSVRNSRDKTVCEDNFTILKASRTLTSDTCALLTMTSRMKACLTSVLYNAIELSRGTQNCGRIGTEYDLLVNRCHAARAIKKQEVMRPRQQDVRQKALNALLIQNPDGTFREEAINMGVAKSYWSWNSRFADFNNDGYLDVYVVSASSNFDVVNENFLFLNKGGKKFEVSQAKFGLNEDYNSSSFVLADFDRDGDLDIITNAVLGPPRIFRNDIGGSAASFEFGVSKGTVVGARVTAEFGGGQKQIREIKASGGYMSYDPFTAHFGMGELKSINKLTVEWPDGTNSVIPGPLRAGRHYKIERL
jgi:uncharacterized membrane protein YraQ (UPF0718 family)